MVLRGNSTVFDVLAYLCGLLDKEDERECSIQWSTATQKHIKTVTDKNKDILDIVLKASLTEYRLSIGDVAYLNSELNRLKQEKDIRKQEIYMLTVQVEHRIEKFSEWQNEKVLHEVKPLNTNVELTNVAIYPCTHPCWSQEKSERKRERTLNACFSNFMMLRSTDASPFEFVMHYWNDTGVLKNTEEGWTMSVALSPVMDCAELATNSYDTTTGEAICVDGLKNGDTVLERVLKVFDEVFAKQYSIIVFPEALGTQKIVLEIKSRMRMHPEYCTFVLLPTICEGGKNALLVLGPGGVECLIQNKVTPFILLDNEGIAQREDLVYDNQIHLLITEELGLVAFSICADLLDPNYYHAITGVARVDTIICPSFSPGTNAFKDTMLRGTPLKLLELYVNTCSAKTSSRSGMFNGELAMVQLPYVKEGVPFWTFPRMCGGQCSKTICYFDVNISFQNETFRVEGVHKCA